MSDEILAAFAAEGAEILEGLESSIDELEAGKGGAIDSVFRAVHTLKGSAAIVGLPLLEAFAHGIEGRLVRLRSGEAAMSDEGYGVLHACRDRMAAIFALGAEAPAALSEAELSLLGELDAALSAAEAERPSAAAAASANSAGVPESASLGAAYSRVANDKLDVILEEASEISQSLSELGRRLKEAADPSLAEQALSIYGMSARHYRSVLSLRTVPFGEVVERYRRAAVDIARASGKEIDCEVIGGDTEIDKALADRLAEPLLHLTRNSADHGIEVPEARLAAGKGRRGTITFAARRDSGFLLVRVSDDGRGVDPRAVRERAAEAGLLGRASAGSGAAADDEALLSLLLLPGFSLSKDVTKWSGRGVGLDAVDRSVRASRGSLRLRSVLGSGFEAEIRLPLALSLVEGFTASAGGTELLVPFESVLSCGMVEPLGSFEPTGSSGSADSTAVVGGQLLPALDLGRLYGELGSACSIAIVVESGGVRAALLVESVGEALSAAVRPLDRRFADSPGISGISALGDGSLVLVLDAAELVRLAASGGRSLVGLH